ncbi:hypothetical protein ACWER6_28700 [Streptomyces sp. NPDC004009]
MSELGQRPTADPRVPAIPRTINAIGDALSPGRRMAFFAAVGGAEQGERLNDVMSLWWMEAMFERVPGREQRLADTVAGRGLVPLPEVVEEAG